MQINPSSSCKACAYIEFRFKDFFIVVIFMKPICDRSEILGSDVILAYRMMKSSIRDTTGYNSYLLFSEQVYQKLSLKAENYQVTS